MSEPTPKADSTKPDSSRSNSTRPRNAIVVLLDSLNRHMLGGYGGHEFETPNLDRFAARSVRFDRHFVGIEGIDGRLT